MKSDFKRIYTGSLVNAQHIEDKLKEFDITPVIKDESESGRLAGFAPPVFGQVQVFVHEDEFEKATALLIEMQLN
jgi:hypothetical protein